MTAPATTDSKRKPARQPRTTHTPDQLLTMPADCRRRVSYLRPDLAAVRLTLGLPTPEPKKPQPTISELCQRRDFYRLANVHQTRSCTPGGLASMDRIIETCDRENAYAGLPPGRESLAVLWIDGRAAADDIVRQMLVDLRTEHDTRRDLLDLAEAEREALEAYGAPRSEQDAAAQACGKLRMERFPDWDARTCHLVAQAVAHHLRFDGIDGERPRATSLQMSRHRYRKQRWSVPYEWLLSTWAREYQKGRQTLEDKQRG